MKARAVDFLNDATLNKQDFILNMSVLDDNIFGKILALSYFTLQISYYGP
jgi:hypothetical protein